MHGQHEGDAAVLITARIRHALAAAGLAPDRVDTRIQATPQAINVQVLRADGWDVTLDQLVTIAAILRSTERSGRAITAAAA